MSAGAPSQTPLGDYGAPPDPLAGSKGGLLLRGGRGGEGKGR